MGVSVNSNCDMMVKVKSVDIGAGDGEYDASSDVDMINFDEGSPYTSLKDIVESTSPTSWMIASPNKQGSRSGGGEGSWREIPIKDPLVQHAAWAYMLPMSGVDGGEHHRNFVQKLKDRCCGVFGCLNGVATVMVKNWKL